MNESKIRNRLMKFSRNKKKLEMDESPPFNPDEPYCAKPYFPNDEMSILPYNDNSGYGEMNIQPYTGKGRMIKGSKEAKDKMARIRAMRGKNKVIKNKGKGLKEDVARFLYKNAPDAFSHVPLVGPFLKPIMKGAIKGISKLSPNFDIEGQGNLARYNKKNNYGGSIPWGFLGKIATPAAGMVLSYGVNKLLKKIDEKLDKKPVSQQYTQYPYYQPNRQQPKYYR